MTYLGPRGWKSNDVITRAVRELVAAGFVHQTAQGHRPSKASWYAVTWRALDRHPGYDVGTVEGPMTEAEEREQVAQVAPPVAKHGRAQDKGFAADTAQISGESKAAINRHLARAKALGDDLDKVTGTSLDKGVELDALKAMTPEQRAPLIERAQAGEKVSARDTSKPASQILTPSMRLQMALMHGIGRALESAGVKTAEELVAQIMALPVRERDFLANQLDVFEYVGCLGSNRGGA